MTEVGVKERFLKFEGVADNKQSQDLAGLVLDVLESYDCKSKLVAQCYDGTAVIASGLNGVQACVKAKVLQALFMHCYAHTLNLVMFLGRSKIKESKIFFANLCGLSVVFTCSPKHTKILDESKMAATCHAGEVEFQYQTDGPWTWTLYTVGLDTCPT